MIVAGSGDCLSYDAIVAELLAQIPRSAVRVLDVGCGRGVLGEALKARQSAKVVGIERSEGVAVEARKRLDQVLVGEPGTIDMQFAEQCFDCIVCADLLSFQREPERALRRLHRWLAPGGQIVAALPNVRHHSAVSTLLQGRWANGIESTSQRLPLRFFTRREMEKLFYRTGFGIPRLTPADNRDLKEWRGRGRLGRVQVGCLEMDGLAPDDAEEFFVYQYILSAGPAPVVDHGLTSIVILTHNQIECTRLCLDSIRLRTDEPYELIVVDNASTDGTVDYLRSVAGVKLIVNDTNRGFPAGVNQGIAAAAGTQILLLNNDCIVTTSWLRRLLDALKREPRIGLVGPCSNYVAGAQQVAVAYDDGLMGLDGFAWDWGKAHDKVLEDTTKLVGFCLLIRREVVDKIGLMDEQFGIGNFEDDDYSRRALQAGWRVVIARDAFVHHFGSRTFFGSGIDYGALMRRNHQLYTAKWAQTNGAATDQIPGRTRLGRKDYGLRRVRRGGLLLVPEMVRLSLCMIVRDNARTIEACLKSIKPWVDEIIVVDTGSTDETPAICERLGARVFRFAWCDDFSAARNESLRHARGDWVFWIDSDDTIDAKNGRKLRALADQDADKTIMGYVMQVHCPGAGSEGMADVTIVDHVKLFRNLPGLRFDGRIHEQICPAIRAAGGEIAFTDVFVVHTGYDHSPEGQKKKIERDLRILHQELRERPQHPFTLFNLGMTYADIGGFQEATEFLTKSIERSGNGESHLRKAYALLVYCQGKLGEGERAMATCREGRRLFPQDAELRFREGLLLHESGRLEEAVQAYQDVLGRTEEPHFGSLDRGITGFKARQNLAVVYTDIGDLAAAEAQWRLVVDEMPTYRAGWRGLSENLLHQGKTAEAERLAKRLAHRTGLECEALIIKGQVATAHGDLDEAKEALERAVEAFPEDREAREARCRLLFEHGQPAEAERALLEQIERDPTDAAAHHNLGTVHMRLGQYGAAADCYRESLHWRPEHEETRRCLGLAEARRSH
jgi:GT2 family glycosyltransferase/tetratricopeptide (TPR) repeat protein/SAM-dependent methyltransferase